MARDIRFRKSTSDRSGFDYKKREMVKDGSSWVGPDEKDDPPPSRFSLGGEGDISRGTYFRSSTSTEVENANPTFYITAAGGISPTTQHPYMRVTGSNGAVTISANPRIARGREGQVLTLFCTDSAITMANGNGIATIGSQSLVMRSGAVSVFMYSTGDTAWRETSRVAPEFGIGG